MRGAVKHHRAGSAGSGSAAVPNVNNGGSSFFAWEFSPLYRPIPDNAPQFAGHAAPNSVANAAGLISRFNTERQREANIVNGPAPSFAGTARPPFWVVPSDTALDTSVIIDNTAFADEMRGELADGVPLPAGFHASSDGTDPGDIVASIWSPSLDKYWELYQMQQRLHMPGPFASATPSSGGSVPSGLQVYKITAFNANGETYGRSSGYQCFPNGSQKVTVDWSGFLTPGNRQAGWRIYRGTSTTPSQNFFLAEVGPTTKTYVDTGSVALDTGRPIPTKNTATTPGQWQCYIGATMHNVSASPGWWRNLTSGAGSPQSVTWGSSASSLMTQAIAIQKGDIIRGEINHAIGMALPNSPGIVHPTVFAYPAQGTDGKSTLSDRIPYGTRFRFPASTNFNTYNYPGLSDPRHLRFASILAKGIQRYGAFPREGSSNMIFYLENPILYSEGYYQSHAELADHTDLFFYDDRATTNWVQDYCFTGTTEARLIWASLPWDTLEVPSMALCNDTSRNCPRGGEI